MTVYAGDRSPKAFALDVTPNDGVNLSQVTAWEMRVRRPDGTRATWSADASGVTPTTAKVTHVFAADGSDLPIPGAYDVIVWLTFSNGGQLQTDPYMLTVYDSFGTRV